MKKNYSTIQYALSLYNAIAEKFPDAMYGRRYCESLGRWYTAWFSDKAEPKFLIAKIRKDQEVVLAACDAVEMEDEVDAVVSKNVAFAPWWVILRVLRQRNPEAYRALLDLTIEIGRQNDDLIHMSSTKQQEYLEQFLGDKRFAARLLLIDIHAGTVSE